MTIPTLQAENVWIWQWRLLTKTHQLLLTTLIELGLLLPLSGTIQVGILSLQVSQLHFTWLERWPKILNYRVDIWQWTLVWVHSHWYFSSGVSGTRERWKKLLVRSILDITILTSWKLWRVVNWWAECQLPNSPSICNLNSNSHHSSSNSSLNIINNNLSKWWIPNTNKCKICSNKIWALKFSFS